MTTFVDSLSLSGQGSVTRGPSSAYTGPASRNTRPDTAPSGPRSEFTADEFTDDASRSTVTDAHSVPRTATSGATRDISGSERFRSDTFTSLLCLTHGAVILRVCLDVQDLRQRPMIGPVPTTHRQILVRETRA
jgi:hypothetical protein